MKNFEKAQIAIDSVATHASVVLLADVFRHIVLPGLTSSEDLGNGFYKVKRNDLDRADFKNVTCLFHDSALQKEAFRLFNYLTVNPLDRDAKKMRSVNVSSPACISDSLVQIRRMLLVRSADNERNLFALIKRNPQFQFTSDVNSAESFAKCEVAIQYLIAGEVFFEILRSVIIQYPGVVQVQIQSDLKSNFRLLVWGNFKMK